MGIIKAVINAVSGGLADQWLEVVEPDDMGEGTVFTRGVKVRSGDSRNRNRKGTDNTVSNGSVIHVYKNQFMMLGGWRKDRGLYGGGRLLYGE